MKKQNFEINNLQDERQTLSGYIYSYQERMFAVDYRNTGFFSEWISTDLISGFRIASNVDKKAMLSKTLQRISEGEIPKRIKRVQKKYSLDFPVNDLSKFKPKYL